jgi:hypothetical protein
MELTSLILDSFTVPVTARLQSTFHNTYDISRDCDLDTSSFTARAGVTCELSFVPEQANISLVCGSIGPQNLVELTTILALDILNGNPERLKQHILKAKELPVSINKFKRSPDSRDYAGIQLGPLPYFAEQKDLCFDLDLQMAWLLEKGKYSDREAAMFFSNDYEYSLKLLGKDLHKWPKDMELSDKNRTDKVDLLLRGFETREDGPPCLWLSAPKKGSNRVLCVYKEAEDVVVELKTGEACGILDVVAEAKKMLKEQTAPKSIDLY